MCRKFLFFVDHGTAEGRFWHRFSVDGISFHSKWDIKEALPLFSLAAYFIMIFLQPFHRPWFYRWNLSLSVKLQMMQNSKCKRNSEQWKTCRYSLSIPAVLFLFFILFFIPWPTTMEGRPHKGALFQKMNTDFTSKIKSKRSEVRRDIGAVC